ncbi:enoyl-CoA hydratase/isomerase family protein [Leptospira inadai serovar Lyme str. 10]|uniref:Enoyl-CoA hydratase/isomerase family protein n=2 Tax=Leptospira inadai serovar Lyme TaxID=293084 RepID=V6HCR7_9LEPT|nr:crotonase/enoyl-CoA hydratase family protein [Leptospira inadai]EQA36718.1 enoyl-CoA hydratase/isomerase family protein [Leptospira inadai serovar Lyme str. 10]PNV74536.1 enoyl-CoA hydratase [Leptospira inadai serovar Lyme]
MSTINLILTEKRNHVFLIGLNRPEERNAMNTEMLNRLSEAYSEFEDDPELRCAVLYANGMHFTLGLELNDVAETIKKKKAYTYSEHQIDPWDNGATKRVRTKPIVCAVHGFCFTLGIELLLACDVCIAAEKTRFAQVEVQRGIMPFGGATFRFVKTAGWGNAMRYILTGDDFPVEEAFRMGLVQEIVPKKELLQRAIAMAERISEQAPLAVQAAIASARKAVLEGESNAAKDLLPITLRLMESEDGAEGVRSFLEKRKGKFIGK